jgi:hypothetical protein
LFTEHPKPFFRPYRPKPMVGRQERVRKPADRRGGIHRVLHWLPAHFDGSTITKYGRESGVLHLIECPEARDSRVIPDVALAAAAIADRVQMCRVVSTASLFQVDPQISRHLPRVV